MKFPSLFRTTAPMRFDVKPRYYDPIKEELEERTSRIKRELEEEGLLSRGEEKNLTGSYQGNLRGSFSQYRGIKPRNGSLFNSTAMVRTLLFFTMIIGAFGYIYLGPVILYYMLYAAIAFGGIFYGYRFLRRGKKDD